MKRLSSNQAFTLLELFIVIAVAAVLVMIALPHMNRHTCSPFSKPLNNAKEIVKGCILFAYENDGKFPDGTYNQGEPGGVLGTKAYKCFTDLIQYRIFSQESFFWEPKSSHVCAPTKPNENGKLEAGECAWDYIRGMTNNVDGSLPLVFNACTTARTSWDKNAGHPWDRKMIVSRCDGSGYILDTDKNHMVKEFRVVGNHPKKTEVNLIGSVSEAEGFPAGAFYTPTK